MPERTIAARLARRLAGIGTRLRGQPAPAADRLVRLREEGFFDSPQLPVPKAFEAFDPTAVYAALAACGDALKGFDRPQDDTGYSFRNAFFSSPDAEVAFAMVASCRPRTIVEIGSGNSTFLLRAAIEAAGLPTRLVAIDPQPRRSIEGVADEVIAEPVERLDHDVLLGRLEAGDAMLFIDSSHEIEPGNDVLALYLDLLPRIPDGTVVHIHDVFIPYEYPAAWLVEQRRGYREHYLVHALLTYSDRFSVLWPGHYLQRTDPGFRDHFVGRSHNHATSLWLRKETPAG